jgi:hypothetical protein
MPVRVKSEKKGLTCLSISGVPIDIYDAFKKKLKEEGYTIQEGFYLLIKAYLEDRIKLD